MWFDWQVAPERLVSKGAWALFDHFHRNSSINLIVLSALGSTHPTTQTAGPPIHDGVLGLTTCIKGTSNCRGM